MWLQDLQLDRVCCTVSLQSVCLSILLFLGYLQMQTLIHMRTHTYTYISFDHCLYLLDYLLWVFTSQAAGGHGCSIERQMCLVRRKWCSIYSNTCRSVLSQEQSLTVERNFATFTCKTFISWSLASVWVVCRQRRFSFNLKAPWSEGTFSLQQCSVQPGLVCIKSPYTCTSTAAGVYKYKMCQIVINYDNNEKHFWYICEKCCWIL